jgi:hypothetical protein
LTISSMIISIDFDNTIANYDEAFRREALRQGLIERAFTGDRIRLRDAVRSQPDGEIRCMALQGYVYGAGINDATPSAGFFDFSQRMRALGHELVIVSHKTEHGHFDAARVNLRDAAMQWMEDRGFFGGDHAVLPRQKVYFELSRDEKIARIAALSPLAHIDDLEDIFRDAKFPPHICGILLGKTGRGAAGAGAPECCGDWEAVEREILRVVRQ